MANKYTTNLMDLHRFRLFAAVESHTCKIAIQVTLRNGYRTCSTQQWNVSYFISNGVHGLTSTQSFKVEGSQLAAYMIAKFGTTGSGQ